MAKKKKKSDSLESAIAALEGKKVEVSIGNIREMRASLVKVIAQDMFEKNETIALNNSYFKELERDIQKAREKLWKKEAKKAGQS